MKPDLAKLTILKGDSMTDNIKNTKNKSLSSSVFSLLKSLVYKYAPSSLAFFGLLVEFLPIVIIITEPEAHAAGFLFFYTLPAGAVFVLIALIWDRYTSKLIVKDASILWVFLKFLFILPLILFTILGIISFVRS